LFRSADTFETGGRISQFPSNGLTIGCGRISADVERFLSSNSRISRFSSRHGIRTLPRGDRTRPGPSAFVGHCGTQLEISSRESLPSRPCRGCADQYETNQKKLY